MDIYIYGYIWVKCNKLEFQLMAPYVRYLLSHNEASKKSLPEGPRSPFIYDLITPINNMLSVRSEGKPMYNVSVVCSPY